jgi:glycosyltransferase involved in cell wall biosynthesis
MRLLVDLQACQGPSADRGIGYYALSLTRALAQSQRGHEVLALVDGGRPPANILRVRHRLGPSLRREAVRPFPTTKTRAHPSWWREAAASREAAIAATQPDAVLITSLFELGEDAAMSVNELSAGFPTAAVLYDLIPLLDLDHYKPDPRLRKQYLEGLERLQRVDLLLAISEYSASEAERLLPACPPVTAVYGAGPPRKASRRPPTVAAPGFVLTVGQDEARKDIPTAVRGWAAVPPEVRRGRVLVMVGTWGSDSRERLHAVAVQEGLDRSDLVFAGAVDDAEMTWLYENAAVLLFPSLVEGLGLPPLQAMEAGTPALMSRSSSLVELARDEAPYFTPGRADELGRLLTRALTDDAFREHLCDLADSATARFSWPQTAELAWDALERLTKSAPLALAAPLPSLALISMPDSDAAQHLGKLAAARHQVTFVEHTAGERLDTFRAHWWRYNRIAYVLDGADAWRVLRRLAVDCPGTAIALTPKGAADDVAHVAAASAALLASSAEAAREVVARSAAAPVPIHLFDPSAGGAAFCDVLERATCQDFAGRFADAYGRTSAGRQVEDLVLHAPRWTAPRPGPVFVSDVTLYEGTPFLSGIQRVVGRLHSSLSDVVEPQGGSVLPARIGASLEGEPHAAIRADPVLLRPRVEPEHGDWLLGLDYHPALAQEVERLQRMRAAGTSVAVNVYDLLPHTHPEWFPSEAADDVYRPWLRAVTSVADVLLVNSAATAQELRRFVDLHPPARVDSFTVHVLPLGVDTEDLDADGPTQREKRHFLVVGTVEPRKGHDEVLDAFEDLWSHGADVRLTVVGRAGWMVEGTVARMERLSLSQPLFTWLRNANDQTLDSLYSRCTACIIASRGEGFGLPVIEAAARGCPQVVRDIPVLREVAGSTATYFGGPHGALSTILAASLDGGTAPTLPASQPLSWLEIAQRLVRVLAGDVAPHIVWSPDAGWE